VGNFENRTTISDIFSQFSAAHAQKRPEIHFRSNFEFKIGNPYGLFPIRLRISAALTTGFMRVLAKTAFVVQNSRNLGANGGDHFDEKPKGTPLADFTRFEPLCVPMRSRVFICPIAIAYSMGPIIKSVCVCQSVYHQNWHRRKNLRLLERVH